jgi:hypothetical protein
LLIFLLYVLLTAIALFIPPMDPLFLFLDRALFSLTLHVPDVSLVPDLTMQLMFARQITDHDYCVIFDPDVCYIQDHRTGHLVGTDPCRRDSQHLWELDWLRLPSAAPASLVSSAYTTSFTSSFTQ